MDASVIHFGADTCSRVLVLQNAGYAVHQCSLISELSMLLCSPSLQPGAVLIGASCADTLADASALAHFQSIPPPVIYFPEAFSHACESRADLVIPPFTSPEKWLRWMAVLIDQSRAVRTVSVSLRERSAALRRELAAVGERNLVERRHSVQVLAAGEPLAKREARMALLPASGCRLPN